MVDYVFRYPRIWLCVYHGKVMAEMEKRGYKVCDTWRDCNYRGGKREPDKHSSRLCNWIVECSPTYPEHNDAYLAECIEILKGKGVEVDG